jgi:hypothetical protein
VSDQERKPEIDRRGAILLGGGLAVTIPAMIVTVIVLAVWGRSAGTHRILDSSPLTSLGAFMGLVLFAAGGFGAGLAIARVLRWERPAAAGMALAICGLIYGSASGALGLPLLNCALDGSRPTHHTLEVLSLETRSNKRSRYTVAILRHWRSAGETVEVPVPPAQLATVRVGSKLRLTIREGALGFPWRETD